VVILDHWGSLIVAQSWCKKGKLDPLAVEAVAVGMALKTCKALRYEKVQFERDAKIVVDAINNGEVDRGRIGHVVEDLRAEVKWSTSWRNHDNLSYGAKLLMYHIIE
jgi:ribonuclease HI